MAQKTYKDKIMELYGGQQGQQTGGAQQPAPTAQQQSNAMLELILNRQPFSYDAKTDPAAQAARKEANRNARMVTQNTMGQYAGMTGGMPSTAAVSAAAQAGNQAMSLGADKVAELQRMAYNNYQTEGQNMNTMLALLQQQAGDEYNRAWNEDQRDYDRAQDEYQNKLALAQLKASYGDYSGLKELGIDVSNYGSGGSGVRYYKQSDETPKVDDSPTGLTDADYNDLLLAQGTSSYESVWARLAAQHGEAALIAAGFKKPQKAPSTNTGAPVRETIGQPGKPAIMPN